jgi:integrase
MRLHDLRHGWASQAVAAGVDAPTVPIRLGRADAGFTAHFNPEADLRGWAVLGSNQRPWD